MDQHRSGLIICSKIIAEIGGVVLFVVLSLANKEEDIYNWITMLQNLISQHFWQGERERMRDREDETKKLIVKYNCLWFKIWNFKLFHLFPCWMYQCNSINDWTLIN